MRSDAVATVLLAEWALTTNYFDGVVLDGPVPRYFAANPAEARAALSADDSKAYKDLQRIFSRLFITENIPASDAWAFVGNPRQIVHVHPNVKPILMTKITRNLYSKRVTRTISGKKISSSRTREAPTRPRPRRPNPQRAEAAGFRPNRLTSASERRRPRPARTPAPPPRVGIVQLLYIHASHSLSRTRLRATVTP
jgi:hypothetical protein